MTYSITLKIWYTLRLKRYAGKESELHLSWGTFRNSVRQTVRHTQSLSPTKEKPKHTSHSLRLQTETGQTGSLCLGQDTGGPCVVSVGPADRGRAGSPLSLDTGSQTVFWRRLVRVPQPMAMDDHSNVSQQALRNSSLYRTKSAHQNLPPSLLSLFLLVHVCDT